MKYTITQSRLLYVLSQGDRKHQGLLKIGEVFVDNDIADSHSSQKLGKAVRAVLDARSYMQGVSYVSVSAMPPCPLLFIIIPLPPNQNQ